VKFSVIIIVYDFANLPAFYGASVLNGEYESTYKDVGRMTIKHDREPSAGGERSVQRLVRWMTIASWTTLLVGLGLSLMNLSHFSERNVSLMVGIGFMVGSVHIYVIRTAIHLVHAHAPNLFGNRERV